VLGITAGFKLEQMIKGNTSHSSKLAMRKSHIKNAINRYTPEPIYRILAGLYHLYKHILEKLHSLGLVPVGALYPPEWHENMTGEQWQSDAQIIAEALDREFHPESVIDLGCGVGLHLSYFHQNGIVIHGVDGAEGAKKKALIPETEVEIADLREPYHHPDSFDLVICFEVAEHLPKESADVLIDSISHCGDTVAFTAAPPGQGGSHHLNEQPQEYWIEKFESRGYDFEAHTSERIKKHLTDLSKTTWIPSNLMIFKNQIN
jgi:2-polyprenyl-3-methyl-5-hydroxy-6-metoxy-1,4-benzoquinol methylase